MLITELFYNHVYRIDLCTLPDKITVFYCLWQLILLIQCFCSFLSCSLIALRSSMCNLVQLYFCINNNFFSLGNLSWACPGPAYKQQGLCYSIKVDSSVFCTQKSDTMINTYQCLKGVRQTLWCQSPFLVKICLKVWIQLYMTYDFDGLQVHWVSFYLSGGPLGSLASYLLTTKAGLFYSIFIQLITKM